MAFLDGFNPDRAFDVVRSAQAWLFEKLIAANLASGDLRWAIIGLGLRSLSALLLTLRWQQGLATSDHPFNQ